MSTAKHSTPPSGKKPPTKAEAIAFIARDTGLTREEVHQVFYSLRKLLKRNLCESTGSGTASIPGLAKIRVVERAATRPRRGVNPVTGEHITIEGKPPRKVIKLQPLKPLRDMLGIEADVI